MTAIRHHVTIKGVKGGLNFILDDQCELSVLLEELAFKLEKTHQQILTGPIIHVQVKLGKRQLDDEQKEQIHSLIRQQGNLVVQSIESDPTEEEIPVIVNELRVQTGIVRSGQSMHHEGDLLFIGDINPGGTITCTGSIYLLGALRGVAHAGFAGDEQAIIIASYMRPTQLRIAEVISRPPDEWGIGEVYMEFAYLADNGKMEIDKIQHLHRLRPAASTFYQQFNEMG